MDAFRTLNWSNIARELEFSGILAMSTKFSRQLVCNE